MLSYAFAMGESGPTMCELYTPPDKELGIQTLTEEVEPFACGLDCNDEARPIFLEKKHDEFV